MLEKLLAHAVALLLRKLVGCQVHLIQITLDHGIVEIARAALMQPAQKKQFLRNFQAVGVCVLRLGKQLVLFARISRFGCLLKNRLRALRNGRFWNGLHGCAAIGAEGRVRKLGGLSALRTDREPLIFHGTDTSFRL